MKIISCHVDNFGKLSNLDINFNEHVNIINKPNGWGKSTLAAFFSAMLYGFDNKKESGALEKDRKKYQPWQGGPYGGRLTFEIDGKRYTISRSFGNTEKTDEFHLYDGETNLESEDYSQNIGEELFDIDRASFKRTIYIAQNDCLVSSTDSISAKLGNLAENTNDINNFETAQERIKNMMNKLHPNRITGSIKKRGNVISQLKMDIKGFEAAEKSMDELSDMLEERRAQKQELLDIRQEYARALKIASEESRRKESKVNYERICKELENAELAFNEARKELPSIIPTDEELDSQVKKAKMLKEQSIIANNFLFTEEEEDSYRQLRERFKNGTPAMEELEKKLEDANNISRVKTEHGQLEMKLSQMESVAMLTDQETIDSTPKKSKLVIIGLILLMLGIVAAGSSAILEFAVGMKELETVLIAGMVVGVIIAVAGIVLNLMGKKRNTENARELTRKLEAREEQKKAKEEPINELKAQLEEIEKGIEVLKAEALSFVSKYGIECDVLEIQSKLYELKGWVTEYKRLQEKEQKYVAAENEYDIILHEITDFGVAIGISFSDEIDSDLNQIKRKSAECRLLEKQFDAAKAKKTQFEEEHDMEATLANSECPYSLDELNRMIHEVDDKVEEIQEGIEQYSRQMENLQEQLDQRDEKLQELANCEQLQIEEQHKYDVLEDTKNFLQSAKEQFTARYMAPISDGFQKYYGILTRDDSRDWVLDANISFKMREYGELREALKLSSGYQDLIGICMRFALVDAMYQEEKPFLILDDPFVNLDDEKAAHGEELLIELENKYQVIYFTCHESREYHQ